jgi:hypothetical protein
MKSLTPILKNTNNSMCSPIIKRKKKVTFKDEYDNKYLLILIVLFSVCIVYSLYIHFKNRRTTITKLIIDILAVVMSKIKRILIG